MSESGFAPVAGHAEVDCVCAALRMATRAMSRVYDEALAPAGLRTTQYSILARLRVDGPLPVGRLAERLAMDRTTLSREIEPLVAAGLVSRREAEDRRRRVLELTPEGRERLRAARPLWERAQEGVRASLGEERAEALVRELHALVALPLEPLRRSGARESRRAGRP
jgi:DNA-binding MarR family transcriptional regulator